MPLELPFLISDDQEFPLPGTALTSPNGLLALGGALTKARLLEAYGKGIFPWFNSDDEYVLWWSPDPRAVLFPDALYRSQSLKKLIRQRKYQITFDMDFKKVITECARCRRDSNGTWITNKMSEAYQLFHKDGFAHSVEVWSNQGTLAGGLYGVSLGRMFYGESMFSRESNASKLALTGLIERLIKWDFICLDCQIMNPHLASMGACDIPRKAFYELLARSNEMPTRTGSWAED